MWQKHWIGTTHTNTHTHTQTHTHTHTPPVATERVVSRVLTLPNTVMVGEHKIVAATIQQSTVLRYQISWTNLRRSKHWRIPVIGYVPFTHTASRRQSVGDRVLWAKPAIIAKLGKSQRANETHGINQPLVQQKSWTIIWWFDTQVLTDSFAPQVSFISHSYLQNWAGHSKIKIRHTATPWMLLLQKAIACWAHCNCSEETTMTSL